ncbi:MAG: hypothetical protein GY708_23935 [Actinomycetia bacterium]|nr:hypothetical protein [Actinomycetes bacterium]MCP4957655.1 hypothetical protein [Actinomycetes bacterium]
MHSQTRTSRQILALLVALLAMAGACSGDGDNLSSPTTLIIEDDSGPTSTTEGNIEVPTVDDDTTESTVGSDETAADDTENDTANTADTLPESTDTSESSDTTDTSFTSSPPPTGEKKGCPEGLVLVGSNGEEPICQEPGGGCPEAHRLIGAVDGAALCQDDQGNVLRVYPDGTVTSDTSVAYNGPVCRRTDAEGNILELSLAVDQQTCEERGGEYLPNGL